VGVQPIRYRSCVGSMCGIGLFDGGCRSTETCRRIISMVGEIMVTVADKFEAFLNTLTEEEQKELVTIITEEMVNYFNSLKELHGS